MSITGLDHFNIAAPAALLEQVQRFYCEVLGLSVGARPQFNSGSQGYWLYAGNRPLVHLVALRSRAAEVDSDAPTEIPRTGWFSHIAFSCVDLPAFLKRLDAAGVPYKIDDVIERRQVQLFLSDPAGVRVELNFADTNLR